MRNVARLGLVLGSLGLWAAGAQAQIANNGPPAAPAAGGVLLDLAGQSANILLYDNSGDAGQGTCTPACAPTTYSTTFTTPSNISASTITFAFRNDPGYFGFGNVSLLANNTGPNLLADGNFANPTQVLNDPSSSANITSSGCVGYAWCGYNQTVGISAGNLVHNNEAAYPGSSGLTWPTGNGSSYFWVDGATGQYDGLYQTVTLSSNTSYTLSFGLENITSNNSINYPTDGGGAGGIVDGCMGYANYSSYAGTASNDAALTANSLPSACGNSADVVVYVGYPDLPTPHGGFGPLAPPTPSPEPATLALLGSGLAGLGFLRRRRG